MQPTIPDPFKIPENLELSNSERSAIRELVRSDSWKAVQKIFHWQLSRYTGALYNAKDDHSVVQGIIKGIALAQNSVENVEQFFPQQSEATQEEDVYQAIYG